MKCIRFILMEITQSLPKSVNFKFNVWPSLTGVTSKFSTHEGIIFKASLNFNCQILSLQELGGVGEAKHTKYKNSFFSKLPYYRQKFVKLPKHTLDSRSIKKYQVARC